MTQSKENVLSALDRVREKAKRDRKEKFTALLHHVTPERIKRAYNKLQKKAAPGTDGVTWKEYGEELEDNIKKLHSAIHSGHYRAVPTRRVYIPKPNGEKRPLGIAALEDKIVQGVVVEVLNAIYEQDFKGFSYGFRPNKSQHNALDALYVGISRKKVSYVLDADIRKYFDSINHEWLVKFVEHRIGDKRIVRLIQRWLKAGVMENDELRRQAEGTPQGATISPLLANIYLHYVFDLWAQQWRKRQARGEVILIRYADDIVAGFQKREDAETFLRDLKARLEKFSLELHPQKTRIIEFGRFAAKDRKAKGEGKPETFDFLGFTHICSKTKNGKFLIRRKTNRKRMGRKLKAVKENLRKRMHEHVATQGKWLAQVVRGYYQYFAVPTNLEALWSFRYGIIGLWYKTLRRRSQKTRTTWRTMKCLSDAWIPKPTICHPWPHLRPHVIT